MTSSPAMCPARPRPLRFKQKRSTSSLISRHTASIIFPSHILFILVCLISLHLSIPPRHFSLSYLSLSLTLPLSVSLSHSVFVYLSPLSLSLSHTHSVFVCLSLFLSLFLSPSLSLSLLLSLSLSLSPPSANYPFTHLHHPSPPPPPPPPRHHTEEDVALILTSCSRSAADAWRRLRPWQLRWRLRSTDLALHAHNTPAECHVKPGQLLQKTHQGKTDREGGNRICFSLQSGHSSKESTSGHNSADWLFEVTCCVLREHDGDLHETQQTKL